MKKVFSSWCVTVAGETRVVGSIKLTRPPPSKPVCEKPLNLSSIHLNKKRGSPPAVHSRFCPAPRMEMNLITTNVGDFIIFTRLVNGFLCQIRSFQVISN